MSKDKKKKKFFQGMEHLQKIVQPEIKNTDNQEVNIDESIFIKKDFKQLIIIYSIFTVIIVALYFISIKSSFFDNFAKDITALFITF